MYNIKSKFFMDLEFVLIVITYLLVFIITIIVCLRNLFTSSLLIKIIYSIRIYFYRYYKIHNKFDVKCPFFSKKTLKFLFSSQRICHDYYYYIILYIFLYSMKRRI